MNIIKILYTWISFSLAFPTIKQKEGLCMLHRLFKIITIYIALFKIFSIFKITGLKSLFGEY